MPGRAPEQNPGREGNEGLPVAIGPARVFVMLALVVVVLIMLRDLAGPNIDHPSG